MLIYKRRTLREHFGVTDYGIDQLLADGTLEPPYNKGKAEHPRWSRGQVERAERKIYEKSLPPEPDKPSTFRFSKKREARLIARYAAELMDPADERKKKFQTAEATTGHHCLDKLTIV